MFICDFDFEKLYSLIHDETDRATVKMFVEDSINEEAEKVRTKIRQTIENNIRKTEFQIYQEKEIKELDKMKRRGATPEELAKIKAILISTGIYDENMELTEPYRKDLK